MYLLKIFLKLLTRNVGGKCQILYYPLEQLKVTIAKKRPGELRSSLPLIHDKHTAVGEGWH